MTAPLVKELEQIPMSRALASTLARATEYASSQSHVEVTLEHLLLSLTEDEDAEIVLATSNVDVGQLKSDVANQLGRIEDRLPLDRTATTSISPAVRRILEAAAQAAQGRRNEINGAIVLAAIVGDGNSVAANLLRAQGLTFDAAIRALQSALSAPAPAPAQTHRPPEQPRQPQQADGANAEGFLAQARAKVQSRSTTGRPDQHEQPTTDTGKQAQPNVDDETNDSEPVVTAETTATHDIAESTPQPTPAPAAPAPTPKSWAPPKPAQAPQPAQQPRPLRPPPPLPVDVTTAPPPAPAPGHHQPPAQQPPAPQNARSRPPAQPGPLPPGTPPQNPRKNGALTTGGAPAISNPSLRPTGPPSAPWPNHVETTRSRAPTQRTRNDRTQPANRKHREAANRASRLPVVEAGQLVENVPRTMQVDIATLAEASIAHAEIKDLADNLRGPNPVQRHDLMITKAMSVRLRAPDGGFFIETASPETQWILNNLGFDAEEFARWRWNITPRTRGRKRLQLIVSARTVGVDGLVAETPLPDQVIDVVVRANYAKSAKRIAGWTAAAVVGGLLARFGESIWDMGRMLIQAFNSGA